MILEWILIAWLIKYFFDKRIRYVKQDYMVEKK